MRETISCFSSGDGREGGSEAPLSLGHLPDKPAPILMNTSYLFFCSESHKPPSVLPEPCASLVIASEKIRGTALAAADRRAARSLWFSILATVRNFLPDTSYIFYRAGFLEYNAFLRRINLITIFFFFFLLSIFSPSIDRGYSVSEFEKIVPRCIK